MRKVVALVAVLLFGQASAQIYDWLSFSTKALTNTAQSMKATPGTFLWGNCYNPNAATMWVQFYDTTAAVTVGTTAPTLSWPIPATQTSGFFGPYGQQPRVYSAVNGMQVAATTTSTGGVAPSTALQCDFAYR